jgi:hypothetical protein
VHSVDGWERFEYRWSLAGLDKLGLKCTGTWPPRIPTPSNGCSEGLACHGSSRDVNGRCSASRLEWPRHCLMYTAHTAYTEYSHQQVVRRTGLCMRTFGSIERPCAADSFESDERQVRQAAEFGIKRAHRCSNSTNLHNLCSCPAAFGRSQLLWNPAERSRSR